MLSGKKLRQQNFGDIQTITQGMALLAKTNHDSTKTTDGNGLCHSLKPPHKEPLSFLHGNLCSPAVRETTEKEDLRQ